jgi:hypothetical protein
MASAATEPAGACPGATPGVTALIIFAPALPVIPGRFNLTCGIPAITHPHMPTAHTQHTSANPRTQRPITPTTRTLQPRSKAAGRW